MFSGVSIVASVVILLAYAIHRRRRRAKLPPGPPRLPLIGNVHQVPKESPWLQFQEWIQQYGPIVGLDFAGTTVILIGDYDIARDLLDKRGNIYSGRPRSVMAGELTCKELNMLFRQPDAQFTLHQRIATPVLNPRVAPTYTPIVDMESKVLLHKFLHGNDIKKFCEIYSASIVYIMTYGFRIVTNDEWQIHAAHAILENFLQAAQTGAWLVDTFPVMKYIPSFLAPFKQKADKFYRQETDLHLTNMKEARARDAWNWAKDFTNSKEAKEMSEVELAWSLGGLTAAGIETSDIFMRTFFLACVSFPEFVAVAQKEIDDVVCQNGLRMPEFSDFENLPYIHAIVEEVFRWRHLAPGGVPHATLKDDWYNGYFIPKGAIVIPLYKTMREDEKRYDAPLEFRPERWLGKPAQLNNWGYGRRACTGRHIARNTITIGVARTLAMFNIRPRDGKRITVDDSMFIGGLVCAPKPFDLEFEPRSDAHKNLIIREFENVDKNAESLLNKVRKMQEEAGVKLRA